MTFYLCSIIDALGSRTGVLVRGKQRQEQQQTGGLAQARRDGLQEGTREPSPIIDSKMSNRVFLM